jgi:hypothetical protein
MQPSAIGRMLWSGVMFFQMHKRSRNLNQALEVEVVFVPAFQPEVLQDIVRLVVVSPVETLEIPGVAGMQISAAGGFERLNKG